MAGKSHIYNCCSHERSVHCHVWFSEGRLGSLAGKERWPLWTSSHPLGCLGEDGVRQPTWDTKGDPPKKYKLIGTSLWGIYIYTYAYFMYIYINQQYEKLVIMYEHYIYTYTTPCLMFKFIYCWLYWMDIFQGNVSPTEIHAFQVSLLHDFRAKDDAEFVAGMKTGKGS